MTIPLRKIILSAVFVYGITPITMPNPRASAAIIMMIMIVLSMCLVSSLAVVGVCLYVGLEPNSPRVALLPSSLSPILM